jgi:tRNA(His) 5'-end guanylyltransferase
MIPILCTEGGISMAVVPHDQYKGLQIIRNNLKRPTHPFRHRAIKLQRLETLNLLPFEIERQL